MKTLLAINEEGIICHPFKGQRGAKKGFYSHTLSSDNTTFEPVTEFELRKLIESGEFRDKGRIRMLPESETKNGEAGTLKVQKYREKSVR